MPTTVVTTEDRDRSLWLWLNRPAQRNALAPQLIQQLTEQLHAVATDDAVRTVVLAGHGTAFCAGADLNWMREAATYNQEENVADAMALAELLHSIACCPKPVVARVHGPAVGGGVGLVAAADLAITTDEAWFQLSEVRLGLIPAVILPYVIAAIGPRRTTQLTLTAERINAPTATDIGLTSMCVAATELDTCLAQTLTQLHLAGPRAASTAKRFIRTVTEQPTGDDLRMETATQIATVRAAGEAREGMAAFLARRKPKWAE